MTLIKLFKNNIKLFNLSIKLLRSGNNTPNVCYVLYAINFRKNLKK